MRIEANFLADWAELKRDELAKAGFTSVSGDNPERIGLQYFNTLRRVIQLKPRRVFRSKELQCPSQNVAGLDRLLKKARRGENLNQHLTTRLQSADYHDALFNDWGIHHFHLGLGRHAKKPWFIERTEHVLFARVTADIIYCIAVMPHRDADGLPSWVHQELLQTIHSNWPKSIADFRLDAFPANPPLSNATINTFRKKGVTYMAQMQDGTLYAPLGGGYASAGNSIKALMNSDRYLELLHNAEAHVRQNIDRFVEHLRTRDIPVPDPLRLRLTEDDRQFYTAIEGAPIRFWLADKPGLIA